MMWISGRDPHPMCIVCMGAKHAQVALADPQVCAHCPTMPVKILERRLRVAVTGTDSRDPPLAASDTAQKSHATHQPQAPRAGAGIMDEVEPIPSLFGLSSGGRETTMQTMRSVLTSSNWVTWRTERRTSPRNPDPLAQPKQPLRLITTCTRFANEPRLN